MTVSGDDKSFALKLVNRRTIFDVSVVVRPLYFFGAFLLLFLSRRTSEFASDGCFAAYKLQTS
jgi:hypothetical protein